MTTETTEFDKILQERRSSMYHKLHKAKQEIGTVTKGSNNPFFKSKYADLNALIDAVDPTLHKYDLILLQPIIDGNVHSQIIDIESGEMIDSYLPLPNITDPQKLIASITYFRRGTLQSLLCLQAVDDDGNQAAQPEKKVSPIKVKEMLSKERFDKAIELYKKGEATKASIEQYDLIPEQVKILNDIKL